VGSEETGGMRLAEENWSRLKKVTTKTSGSVLRPIDLLSKKVEVGWDTGAGGVKEGAGHGEGRTLSA